MKNIIFLLALLLAFACKKKDDPAPVAPTGTLTLIAKFKNQNNVSYQQYYEVSEGEPVTKQIAQGYIPYTDSICTLSQNMQISYSSQIIITIGGTSNIGQQPINLIGYALVYFNNKLIDSTYSSAGQIYINTNIPTN